MSGGGGQGVTTKKQLILFYKKILTKASAKAVSASNDCFKIFSVICGLLGGLSGVIPDLAVPILRCP